MHICVSLRHSFAGGAAAGFGAAAPAGVVVSGMERSGLGCRAAWRSGEFSRSGNCDRCSADVFPFSDDDGFCGTGADLPGGGPDAGPAAASLENVADAAFDGNNHIVLSAGASARKYGRL